MSAVAKETMAQIGIQEDDCFEKRCIIGHTHACQFGRWQVVRKETMAQVVCWANDCFEKDASQDMSMQIDWGEGCEWST